MPTTEHDIPYPNPLDEAVNVGDLAYMEQENEEYLAWLNQREQVDQEDVFQGPDAPVSYRYEGKR